MQAMQEAVHFYHAVMHITNFTTPIARNAYYMTGKKHTNDMNQRPSMETVCSPLINGQDWHFWVFHNVQCISAEKQCKYWPLIAPPFRVGWACGSDDRIAKVVMRGYWLTRYVQDPESFQCCQLKKKSSELGWNRHNNNTFCYFFFFVSVLKMKRTAVTANYPILTSD